MPTWDKTERFLRDYDRLTSEEKKRFNEAIRDFVEDLRTGSGLGAGLRVTRVQKTQGLWEMTWAPNGRATWQYGPDQRAGERHVIWRRVGGHVIFGSP